MRWPDTQLVTTNMGASGIEMVEKESPDIVILDLEIADMEGIAVLRRIRSFSQVPVVVLTVKNSEMDTASCLEDGADDFITKPFSAIALLARIRAVLRRQQRLPIDASNPPFVAGDLAVDFASRQVLFNGKPVKLTPTEYSILCYLVSNRNRVVSHQAILGELWREEYDDINIVKTFISQLRHKLYVAGAESARMIESIRGVGYRFVASV
jgi:two-component system KDP operon response regulator KdpE